MKDSPDLPASDAAETGYDSPNHSQLSYGKKTIHLIGTAHVSDSSAVEVVQAIEALQPDAVCVELCQSRYQAIKHNQTLDLRRLIKLIRDGRAEVVVANLLMGGYQRRIASQLGVQPGGEMIAAIRAAERAGARLVLADRPIHITLRRLTGALPAWKLGLLGVGLGLSMAFKKVGVTSEQVEAIKEQRELDQMMEQFRKELPEVAEVLLEERDKYLAMKIRDAPGKNILAVVGAGHVAGITEHLHSTIDRRSLEALPKRRLRLF
ncbi:MAG: TraB family protein [Myxococcales bacterium]|nr:TraB family protein [Myxococcales bacterium]